MYIYGGELIETGHITDELWQYNLVDNTWKPIVTGTDPLAVAGHVAHVINDTMYVLCGMNTGHRSKIDCCFFTCHYFYAQRFQ